MSSSTDPPFGSTFSAWTLSVMEHGHWKTWVDSNPWHSNGHTIMKEGGDTTKSTRKKNKHAGKNTTNKTWNAIVISMCVRFAGVGASPAKRHNIVRPKSIRLHCRMFNSKGPYLKRLTAGKYEGGF